MLIMWLLSITQVSQVIIVETSKPCTKIVKIFVKYFCWKISVVAALFDFLFGDVVAALDILRRAGD